jgi:hypothetical protein
MQRHRYDFLPIQGPPIPLYGSFGTAADGGAVLRSFCDAL